MKFTCNFMASFFTPSVETPSVAVAIKVYSMQVLYKICLKEPDLKNELQLLIEDLMPHETAAFVSAGKHILKNLKKLK